MQPTDPSQEPWSRVGTSAQSRWWSDLIRSGVMSDIFNAAGASVGFDQTWMDQSSSWWAKANRAKEHVDSLRRQVDEYRASAPYSLTPEPTEKPDRLAYRLRFSKPAPVAISTTVGDVLHNLRAALESRQTQVRAVVSAAG